MCAGILIMSHKITLAAVAFVLLMMTMASASVGVGISPTKMVLQLEGGKEHQLNLLIFNSGDNDLNIRVHSEGDIAQYVTVDPTSALIKPEPFPHALPIRNGKNFAIMFNAPRVTEPTVITGTFSAVGSPASGSQFGGSVGVAAQVEITVMPGDSFFSRINTSTMIAVGVLVVAIIVFAFYRKAKAPRARKK